MASHLPAQEDSANTYYATAGTQMAITRMKPSDKESIVSGIWNAMLTEIFPPNERYIVRPESHNPGGISDLVVLQYVEGNGQWREKMFLVVQCKRMTRESQDAVWDKAMEGLGKYLPKMKPKVSQHRVYGVAAVGRWAEFVELDRATGSLVAFRQPGKYHIARNCRTIQQILEYIRDHHQ
ncbi:hypothetical protein FQN52_007566 [Onygenales sp. PD_12]|nr:hypothetical protein FQN52_007566 [Onygenales sp. PD_12]